MSLTQVLLNEMEQEAKTTRKMLERIPNDKYDWKPHEKSMTIKHLAAHIAELPGWVTMVLTSNELDFANNPYKAEDITSTAQLLDFFDERFESGHSHLAKATDEDLLPDWTLRNGDQIYSVRSRAEVIRMAYCQIVHHRAQMGVFLRLLDVPIPGSYGPSADEMKF
jgi:uncharacterized damage-inducible protein DinB